MFSAQQTTPIDRDLNKKAVKIIHSLLMKEESAAFRKPVPHKALGLEDYKLIVKRPTDLNLIRRQNNQGKYKFVEEILDEIQLCWDNCKLYNNPQSQIYQQAILLENTFDTLGKEILPQFWVGVNRQEYNKRFSERKEEEGSRKVQEIKSKPKKEYFEEPKSKKKGESVGVSEDFEAQFSEKNLPADSHMEIEGEVAPSGHHFSRDQMEQQEHEEQGVQPVVVKLGDTPSREELVELGGQLNKLWDSEDNSLLSAVLEILHVHEKENMQLNKNGLMTFKMNNIHKSTYQRIRKAIGLETDPSKLIQ